MNILKKILAKLFPTKPVISIKDPAIAKEFEELYKTLGVFTYVDDGFTINYEDFNKKVLWNDITQLNVFKRDLYTIDRIDMEIIIGDSYFTINEELPGWYQFIAKCKDVFPDIPKDWEFEIVQPPFARNERIIYKKHTG